ncbi:MAG: hypothetical protein Q9M25_08155 [Mariprofundaceae bacterium]|nr:hypothetical protein [Mariprofundaceae bacterium]
MMRTGRILVLLSLLSILILGRTGLSLWSGHQAADNVISIAQAAPDNTPIKTAKKPEKQTTEIDQATSSVTQLIPEANALPYTPDSEAISQAERQTLLSLRKIRDALDARQAALEERQKAAQASEEKLSERVADLEALEARIKDMLAQEKSINTKKIKRLTAVYEGMKADRAAPVIERMDLPIVVRMFSRMDEKKVGKILSFLPPEQAVKISQALTERISNVK